MKHNPILDQKINTKVMHHVEIINARDIYDLADRYEELADCEYMGLKDIVAKFKNILEARDATAVRTTWRTINYELTAIIEWRTYE